MQQKHKHDQMNDLEWYRVIVEREQLKIDKRIAVLNLLNDEHKPSIQVKEAELKIFDTNYYEVHKVQEAFQQEKTDKLRTFEFPRIH